MKYFRYIIIFWFLVGFLTGCRAKLDTSRQESQRHIDEIGVVLRRLDSLGSTIAERQHIKIEFYPLEYGPGNPENLPTTGSPQAAPSGTMPAASFGPIVGSGGMGAVKSIEIDTERDATTTSTSAVDSTAVFKTDDAATLQEDKTTEAKHDNGTVFIVAVAAAVVLLLALLIIIKKLFHK